VCRVYFVYTFACVFVWRVYVCVSVYAYMLLSVCLSICLSVCLRVRVRECVSCAFGVHVWVGVSFGCNTLQHTATHCNTLQQCQTFSPALYCACGCVLWCARPSIGVCLLLFTTSLFDDNGSLVDTHTTHTLKHTHSLSHANTPGGSLPMSHGRYFFSKSLPATKFLPQNDFSADFREKKKQK